jgi:hypothetical protein
VLILRGTVNGNDNTSDGASTSASDELDTLLARNPIRKFRGFPANRSSTAGAVDTPPDTSRFTLLLKQMTESAAQSSANNISSSAAAAATVTKNATSPLKKAAPRDTTDAALNELDDLIAEDKQSRSERSNSDTHSAANRNGDNEDDEEDDDEMQKVREIGNRIDF